MVAETHRERCRQQPYVFICRYDQLYLSLTALSLRLCQQLSLGVEQLDLCDPAALGPLRDAHRHR